MGFRRKSLDAEFVSGPLVGTTKHLTVADIKMEQRWEELKAEGRAEGHPSRIVAILLKDVAKDFMKRWCEAIVSDGGAKFEEEWGLQEPVLETPVKKRRGTKEAEEDDLLIR